MLQNDLKPLLPQMAQKHASSPDAYPADNIAALQSIAAFAAPFTPEMGGRNTPLVEMVDAILAIASACPSTALLAAMPMGLSAALRAGAEVAPPLYARAANEQLRRVAEDYRNGLIYAACNSEKGAGGAIAATKTVAKKQGDTFALYGEKILASFGAHADVFFCSAKVEPSELPGAGPVEYFFLDVPAPGVSILSDWNGFGMAGTESHTVRLEGALVAGGEVMGYPDFINHARTSPYWASLFAAIPLGCARASLRCLGNPTSPALRTRLSDARMHYEALRAYLRETASLVKPQGDNAFMQRVMRTKTYVAEQSTRLCAELFALSGGRNYVRGSAMAGALADSFAGTALRPPLPLALETLAETYEVDSLE